MNYGPCYIYVLPLKAEHALHFKLGFTLGTIRARSNALPEKEFIDQKKSFGWRMATDELARSTERTLHAMLRYFGYQRPRGHRQSGYSEWYAPEALKYVENYMDNVRGTWFERVSFTGGNANQLSTVLDGLRLALDQGAITMEAFDGICFYTRIDAGAFHAIQMLHGNHYDGELAVVDCFEPLNGDQTFYAALLQPQKSGHTPFSLEFSRLCNLIPAYTGDDHYFTLWDGEDD